MKALIWAQYIRFNNCDYCLLRNRPVFTVKKHWTMQRQLHYLSKSISLKESNTISTILYILQYSVEHFSVLDLCWVLKIKKMQHSSFHIWSSLTLKLNLHLVYSVSFSREVSYFLSPCYTWYSNLLRFCQDERANACSQKIQ